jgi:hypothetical protein
MSDTGAQHVFDEAPEKEKKQLNRPSALNWIEVIRLSIRSRVFMV